MELRKKVEIFVDKMLKSDTPEGKREADSYFAELNAALTLEEQKEAGQIMREIMAERRKSRKIKRTDINMKEKLAEIQDVISLSYIAKHYFNNVLTALLSTASLQLLLTRNWLCFPMPFVTSALKYREHQTQFINFHLRQRERSTKKFRFSFC